MIDKKVYLVRGSEDGTMDIYTNMQNAYKKALNYFSDTNSLLINNNECTYKTFSTYLKEHWFCQIDKAEYSNTNVLVECHWLNNNL